MWVDPAGFQNIGPAPWGVFPKPAPNLWRDCSTFEKHNNAYCDACLRHPTLGCNIKCQRLRLKYSKRCVKPSEKTFTVKACRHIGWNKDVVTHKCDCATTYNGRTCSGGLYADGLEDLTSPCESWLGSSLHRIICTTESTDCRHASVVCWCIERLRRNPPPYRLGHTCYTFHLNIRDCVHELIGIPWIPNIV